jgi:hypothetical protein
MTEKENWKLRKLTFEFKQGYSFNKTEDRYEGKIEFTNGEFESFAVKLTDEMSEPYLKLVAKEIVKNSQQLADRMANSLNPQNE